MHSKFCREGVAVVDGQMGNPIATRGWCYVGRPEPQLWSFMLYYSPVLTYQLVMDERGSSTHNKDC